LKDKIASRKQAYSFILKKVKELILASNYRLSKGAELLDYISINDLTEPREGISDPSQHLIAKLKCFLKGITSESEINRYLIRPFKYKNPSNNQNCGSLII
jgi:hypothetical protein